MKNYLTNLEKNTSAVIQLSIDLSPELLNVKEENQWSILEILEHLYITDKVIFSVLSKPSKEQSDKNEIVGQPLLNKILVEKKERRYPAPDILYPKGLFKSVEEFKVAYKDLRQSFESALKSEKIKMNNNIYKHFTMGDMTVMDWLNFMILHTERHLNQISNRIKKEEY